MVRVKANIKSQQQSIPIIFAYAVGLLALVVILYLAVRHPSGPSYEEKNLTFWLSKFGDRTDPSAREHAKLAIQGMGTNILPVLVSLLRAKDPWGSRIASRFVEWQVLKAHGFKFRRQFWEEALNGFEALGSNAAPAIPALHEMLGQDDDPFYAAQALVFIGRPSIPTLTNALFHTNRNVRGASAYALGKIGAKEALPALSNAVEDAYSDVRYAATNAIRQITK